MAYVNPLVYDNGLTWLAGQVTALHLTPVECSTYAEVLAKAVAQRTSGLIVSGPAAGISTGGRKVGQAGFTLPGGMIGSGRAGVWYWVNTASSRILVGADLDPPIVCTPGGTLVLESPLGIEIPGVSG